MSKSKHLSFLLSPFLFILTIVILLVFSSNYELIDMVIVVFKGYAIAYFLICSFVFFRIRRAELSSNWDIFIKNGYPVSAAIFFAWIFLLPLMDETIGLWDIEFINMIVTLALSYFLFFWVTGFYEIGYSIAGKKSSSSKRNNDKPTS